MARNIEIKARAADFAAQKQAATDITTRDMEIIHQEDVFFNVPDGRLKLRIFSPEHAELIFYTRPDQQGPKMSNYEISTTHDPEGLKSILNSAYGIRATVVKTRYLFMSGRTRIHFDEVESLGNFIELEVVLSENEQFSDAEDEATGLMSTLGIENHDLIEGAYVDMLEHSET